MTNKTDQAVSIPAEWRVLLERWLQAVFPNLAEGHHDMTKGERWVMTLPVDIGLMERMLAGGRERIDPTWQPADEFIRLIKEAPGPITAESIARWEEMLSLMDPRRDVALYL